jgi:hypothetical protein
MKAVQSCNYDRAIMLVESGADWEMPIRGSVSTVLHILLKHDIPAMEGATPNAKLFGNEGYASYLKLIEILKEKGADFDVARRDNDFVLEKSDTFVRPEVWEKNKKELAQLVKERHDRYEQKQLLKKQQGVND